MSRSLTSSGRRSWPEPLGSPSPPESPWKQAETSAPSSAAAAIDRRHVRANRVSHRIQSVVVAAPQTSVIVLNYTQTAKVLGSFVIKEKENKFVSVSVWTRRGHI